MSRCFPFPPPGYEKKARSDDVDLLIKDKHKEKKHKKEKRDKSKEGKDKKDKERSKDKDREKKERKEKHKDKKKSKDKKKTDEKEIEGQPDGPNGGKHAENNQHAGAIKDTKFAEIGRRIADEERGRRDQMVENIPACLPRKEDALPRLGFRVQDEKINKEGTARLGVRVQDEKINKEGAARLGIRVQEEKIYKEGAAGLGIRVPEENVIKDKDGYDKKIERQKTKDDGRVPNSVGPSFSAADQRRVVGGTSVPFEKDAERRMEGREKNKDAEANDKQQFKHKHREGEKKSKEKKVAEKEKMKEKVKHENKHHDKLIEPPKDHINTPNIKTIQIPKVSEMSGSMEENPRKRKECETNGFLHENDVPNKLPRPTLSSQPHKVNGGKAEPLQPPTPFTSPTPRGANNLRFDNKVLRVNGLIQAQPTSTSSPSVQARENGEASKKPPPHPDSEWLSKILSVPKMDDWSDFDDQEWLFSSDSLQEKKPKSVSSGVDGSPQVWDRALRIESADVCALPYVIPY